MDLVVVGCDDNVVLNQVLFGGRRYFCTSNRFLFFLSIVFYSWRLEITSIFGSSIRSSWIGLFRGLNFARVTSNSRRFGNSSASLWRSGSKKSISSHSPILWVHWFMKPYPSILKLVRVIIRLDVSHVGKRIAKILVFSANICIT